MTGKDKPSGSDHQGNPATDNRTKEPWPAWMAVSGPMLAAGTLNTYMKPVMGDGQTNTNLAVELLKQVRLVNQGNMKDLEGLLTAQAHTLNAIFQRLATRAEWVKSLKQYEIDLKLALRAQSQCRATIEALALMKNPPANVAFVKQANVAQVQQVNNGAQAGPLAAPAAENSPPHLEHTHGNYLDTRTAPAACGDDPAMAAVGEIHRPEDRQG